MENRLRILADVDQYAGKYYSDEWIKKNVLRMTEDDIADIQQQIADAEPEDDEDDEEEDDFESKQL